MATAPGQKQKKTLAHGRLVEQLAGRVDARLARCGRSAGEMLARYVCDGNMAALDEWRHNGRSGESGIAVHGLIASMPAGNDAPFLHPFEGKRTCMGQLWLVERSTLDTSTNAALSLDAGAALRSPTRLGADGAALEDYSGTGCLCAALSRLSLYHCRRAQVQCALKLRFDIATATAVRSRPHPHPSPSQP